MPREMPPRRKARPLRHQPERNRFLQNAVDLPEYRARLANETGSRVSWAPVTDWLPGCGNDCRGPVEGMGRGGILPAPRQNAASGVALNPCQRVAHGAGSCGMPCKDPPNPGLIFFSGTPHSRNASVGWLTSWATHVPDKSVLVTPGGIGVAIHNGAEILFINAESDRRWISE